MLYSHRTAWNNTFKQPLCSPRTQGGKEVRTSTSCAPSSANNYSDIRTHSARHWYLPEKDNFLYALTFFRDLLLPFLVGII